MQKPMGWFEQFERVKLWNKLVGAQAPTLSYIGNEKKRKKGFSFRFGENENIRKGFISESIMIFFFFFLQYT